MILFRGKIKSIKSMKSGNKVIFWTQDVPDELDILQYSNEEGYIAFSVDHFKQSVLEAIEDKRPGVVDDRKNTPSQRLRGIIFQVFLKKYPQYTGLHTQEAKDKWAEAYKKAMEIHIEDWKKRL